MIDLMLGRARLLCALLITAALALGATASEGRAQVTAFMQAVAESAANDEALSQFYRDNGYGAIWTGNGNRDRKRRAALLAALEDAGDHGLPTAAYNVDLLRANLRSVRSERDLGRIEVALSRLFLDYARDIQTGIVTPSRIDRGIVRKIPYRDRYKTLVAFAKSSPRAFIRALPPKTPEYARLMKAKLEMERRIGRGGWGPEVPVSSLEPGTSGTGVVALRNRLIAMGYMRRSATQTYDTSIQRAVQLFQVDHGLAPDGVAGPGTMTEINQSMETRLAQIIVAMERERWMNRPRGDRHVWVNLTDFSAQIIDNGKVTFQTRAVVGANDAERRSPEFSDVMEHMVVNPTWNVPRSIAVKEYLPLMQRNPNAAGHLRVTDARGRTIPRSAIDFRAYTPQTFPFNLKQPPSDGNALGLVKFMFPNRYNIYLHDTPAKNLFAREVRAFSHGCIRLNDPFDFAYTLLARQTSDPVGFFQTKLRSGIETVVPLEKEVPVHLVYRTAMTTPKGDVVFRRDVYGRDARIFRALQEAGVALRSVES